MFRLIRSTSLAWMAGLLLLLSASSVRGQFTTVGTATSLGGNCFRLVDRAVANSKGAIWNNTQINLSNGFDITFHINVIEGSGIGFSADGLAFVVQRQGIGAIAANSGNSLGYANTTTGPPCPGGPHVGGISPSLAVELDFFDNNQANTCIPEMANDHIAVVRNGIFTTPITGPVCAFPVCATNIEGANPNTICRRLRVVYVPSNGHQLQVYFDGNLRINTNYDMITNVFSGNPMAWFGVTAASGGLTSTINVCWEFANAGADQTICSGTPLNLGASGGTTYAWTPAAWVTPANTATPAFNQTSPGTYDLTANVTNNLGCTDTNIVRVIVEPNPTVNAGVNQSICAGDSVLIGPAGANSNYTYSWSPTAGLGNPNSNQTNASPGGTTNYTLTVVDTSTVNNCSANDAVQVSVNPNPVAVPGANDTLCMGDSVQLGGAPVAGLVYEWTPSTGLSSTTIANPMAGPTSNQTYQIVTTNGTTGCDDTASVSIVVNPLPTVDAGPNDTICLGQTANLSGSNPDGATVSWDNGGTLSSTTSLTPTATPNVTTVYTLTLTDPVTGCVNSDVTTVVVNVPDPVNITTADTFICNVDTISLLSTSGPGIDSWSWTPPVGLSNPTSPNTLAFPTSSTTYILTGTNTSTGCQAVDSIRIDVFELDVPGLADDSLCLGDTINLDATPLLGSGNYTFDWTSPAGWISDTSIANPDISSLSTTTFTVTVTDNASTCSATATVLITVSTLQASVSPVTEEINPGQWVHLIASDGDFFSWDPPTTITCLDCQETDVNPTSTTVYTVTISDSTGCTGTATATIIVDSMIVQNVFTPNGDGINDVLMFNYLGEGEYELFVYDRWGALIYNTADATQGWNGKTKAGVDVAEGVYYVQLNIKGDPAIPDSDKNTAWAVTLVR